jgi:hypothetical protein
VVGRLQYYHKILCSLIRRASCKIKTNKTKIKKKYQSNQNLLVINANNKLTQTDGVVATGEEYK